MTRGGVRGRCEKKAEADFANGHSHLCARQIDTHTQSFQHVGRSTPRTDRTIAMFRNPRAASRRYDRSGGRDVEGAKTVSASAAGIDQAVRAQFIVLKYAQSVTPHHARKTRKLGNQNRSLVQRAQETHNLRIVHAPAEQFLHHGFGLSTRKNAARFQLLD